MRDINLIVVHCSATKPSMDIDAATIRQWHKDKGWSDIGYHYVIKRDGTVEKGRDNSIIGAHVKGWNSNSIGICYVGGVTEEDVNIPEDNKTQAQDLALRSLVIKLLKMYPNSRVAGHNQFTDLKECPSFDVPDWLEVNGIEEKYIYKD